MRPGGVRAGAVVAGAIVLLGVLVVVGRWEGRRHADKQNAKILRIREAVGSLDRPRPTGFRILNPFTCLTYRHGSNKYALELCVDGAGRVVEAIDRRSGTPRIASLRDDPGAATVRVDRAEVDRLLRSFGA
jgi:hypothetical protein